MHHLEEIKKKTSQAYCISMTIAVSCETNFFSSYISFTFFTVHVPVMIC